MTTITIEKLLERKFEEFKADLKEYLPDETFEYDENDSKLQILETILFLFPSDNIEFHLDEVLELRGLKVDWDSNKKSKVCEVILKHVNVLRKIKNVINI